MELSPRKKIILKAIIEDYIENAEPVGSKTLTGKWENSLSSATIRNEMSELEELGLLEKTHASSGRIPSQNGYRFYVDELMNAYNFTLREINELNTLIRQNVSKLNHIMSHAGKIISSLTNHPVISLEQHKKELTIDRFEFVPVKSNSYVLLVIIGKGEVKSRLVNTEVPASADNIALLSKLFNTFLTGNAVNCGINEKAELICGIADSARELIYYMTAFIKDILEEFQSEEIFFEGAAKILEYPEFSSPERAKKLIDFFSDAENVKTIRMLNADNDVEVAINPENMAAALKDASIVYKAYSLPDGMRGVIAVVGPTRMNYSKTAASLEAFEKGIETFLLSQSDETVSGDKPPFESTGKED